MKFLGVLFSLVLFWSSCNSNHQQIGVIVDSQQAMAVEKAASEFLTNKKSDNVVVFGRVEEVCQAEGCWFSYRVADSTIIVDFEDEFTVPKNLKKKNLYAVGHFYWETNEDETKSLKFHADGVKFK